MFSFYLDCYNYWFEGKFINSFLFVKTKTVNNGYQSRCGGCSNEKIAVS